MIRIVLLALSLATPVPPSPDVFDAAPPASVVETSKESGIYSCPMHPEVTSDKPGKCPKCGMTLVMKSAPPIAPAAPHDGLTADQAVALAMKNNPRLQIALAENGIARADLMQASTIANPLLEIELRFPGDPYRPYEFRFAQTLIELIQLPRRRAIGRAAYDAALLRVNAAVARFTSSVRAAYVDAIAATQHAALAKMNLEAAQAAAELAIKQHDAGNITDLELENQQASYEQAKLDLARSEQRLVVATEALNRAIGTSEWQLPNAFPTDPESEAAAPERLDIAIARREVAIAEKQVPVARLAALGGIEADVHYQHDANGARTIGPGVVLPIPIFNNGRAARSRAEAQLVRARATLSALLAESSSLLRVARANVAAARARADYYRDVVVPRRTRIVELTKLEHNAMLVGAFQLLQAKQNEAQAQRDFIDAQHDYWLARLALDNAVLGVATEGGH
jgi:cobalt-zinc-cadmium efflux system outer membrane protein